MRLRMQAAMTAAGSMFVLGTCLGLGTTSAALGDAGPGGLGAPGATTAGPAALAGIGEFLGQHPGTGFLFNKGRIERIYGRAFGQGGSPEAVAEEFRLAHASIFGIDAADLVPGSTMHDGRASTPVKYDPATGGYGFTMVSYLQTRAGVPVYGSHVRLLVRNEANHPLVLVSSNLRDIGAFTPAPEAVAGIGVGLLSASAAAAVGGGDVVSTRTVIFAGAGEEVAEPRLALEAIVHDGAEEWRVIVDAENGQTLFTEFLVCFQTVTGTVEGNATVGIGSEQCEAELPLSLPYAKVTAAGQTVYTDADGNYSIVSGGPIASVESTLDGLWFDVFNFAGATVAVSAAPVGDVANLLHNAVNDDPLVRSQINAYREANLVRDFALQYNPAYPTLSNGNFTVNVNRTDGFCPGNAWYSSGEQSINFCQTGGSSPNTAFASVVYHEYGHHLVNSGGSGQGAYGEGMGDVMSLLILDSPLLGLGFFGDCNNPLRNADNDCQYQSSGCSSCGSAIHACGQLLSGCVWDLRKGLLVVDPAGYLDTTASLAINAILLHNGTAINSGITVDYLTLDDDNGDILDGTPHYTQINSAFSIHGLDGPELNTFKFTIVGGAPSAIDPTGQTLEIDATTISSPLNPANAKFNYRIDGGAWIQSDLLPVDSDTYTAVFPAMPCGSEVEYYFLGISLSGQVVADPAGAAAAPYKAFAGYGSIVAFADDFNANTGWTTTNGGGLTDGPWERAVPVANCDRGNPQADQDGSGWCLLTDNGNGGSCNTDVDGGPTTITSPALDASDAGSFVQYWRWYSNIAGDSPYQDVMRVEVSGNNGATWVPLETVGPTGPQVEGGWYFKQFKTSSFVAPSSQFRIRFIAEDAGPGSVVEAAVDAVRIVRIDCTSPAIPGDVNGDGIVDGADLGALLAAWGSNDAAADVNGDGVVDGADLGALLANWG